MGDYQFQLAEILIQPYVDEIGPFTFDLSAQLPATDDIASVLVKSYLDDTETTSELIASSSVTDNVVTIRFNYPGSTLHGTHKITMSYTLASGAKDEADFYGVLVKDV